MYVYVEKALNVKLFIGIILLMGNFVNTLAAYKIPKNVL